MRASSGDFVLFCNPFSFMGANRTLSSFLKIQDKT